jgi:hypothetical protein
VDADFHFSDLFNLLNSEIQKAKNEIFIAAPYVKIGIVKKLDFPEEIAINSIFVCRWKLDDVLTGATDIGVYPLLRDQGIRVLLHPNLHAKYYRSDNRILLGSANLTSNGLINDETSSLEALTVLLKNPATMNFESKLIQESVEVDDELYSEYFAILNSHYVSEPFDEINCYWPNFTSFEEAWSIYEQDYTSISLKQLAIPPTLDKSKLRGFIKIRLKEFSNIQRIEKFLESGADGRRFGEVRALIRKLDESVDETSAWQNLMLLLLDLFPESYEYFRPNHTEIIVSKKSNRILD